jgi:hypothetical protein
MKRSVSLLAVLVVFFAPAAFDKDDEHGRDLGPGCDPDRPAIAHHAACPCPAILIARIR